MVVRRGDEEVMVDVRAALKGGLRQVIGDPRTRKVVQRPRVGRKLINRYVAGEQVDQGVEVAADLIGKGRMISAYHLLPAPEDHAQASEHTSTLRATIQRFAEAGLTGGGRVDFDVNLTTLGLRLGPTGPRRALERARELARAAANTGTTITVLTESPRQVDRVLLVARELRQDFPAVGISLTAAYQRSLTDCEDLATPGSRVRLVRGSVGSGTGVHRRRAQVDRAYARCLRILMLGAGNPVICTDDLRLLRIARALAQHLQRPVDSYEYQLPYGVRPEMQAVIADRGETVRVHLPFGPEWYPYLVGHVAVAPTKLVGLTRAALPR